MEYAKDETKRRTEQPIQRPRLVSLVWVFGLAVVDVFGMLDAETNHPIGLAHRVCGLEAETVTPNRTSARRTTCVEASTPLVSLVDIALAHVQKRTRSSVKGSSREHVISAFHAR